MRSDRSTSSQRPRGGSSGCSRGTQDRFVRSHSLFRREVVSSWPRDPLTTRRGSGTWPPGSAGASSRDTRTEFKTLRSLPTPAGWPLRRTTRRCGSGRWPTASACGPSRGTPMRSCPLPGAPMGNSWPPAAGIGRSDSGARTEPSLETSRIWTIGFGRSCSPPTPGSCSTPGAGQVWRCRLGGPAGFLRTGAAAIHQA